MTDDPVLEALGRLSSSSKRPRPGKPITPAFAAEGQLPLDALAVNVSGMGALAQGLSTEQGQALHAISAPAPFGLRDRTLVDARVRHTGEVAAGCVQLHWAGEALAGLQAEVAAALGLAGLELRLHKLLTYGPGQFFKPHQDTEKHPGMVGTLVLVWPSPHIGGELQVWQGDSVQLFASQHLQTQALRWCAFFADCRHEVKPVQEGWRVVLTFDIVLPMRAAEAPLAAAPALVQALQTLFNGSDAPRSKPWLFLLDHEYTEHGLRWHLLKGQDRDHVGALRAAARALGLVSQLALAEIHQSWTAYGNYNGRRGDAAGAPEPGELIDEDLSLNFWVDEQGQCRKGQALSVALAHCASFTADHAAFLVDEEYEGYMGNYGETLDYWYRRAALVLQSPVAAEATRFATQPEAALADALKLARRADQHAVLAQRLQQALPDLRRHAQASGPQVLARYAQLAAVLPPALARELCTPFEWQQLRPANAKTLAALAQSQGPQWLVALLRSWAEARAERARYGWLAPDLETPGRSEAGLWPQQLPAFIGAGIAARLAPAALQAITAQAMYVLVQADKPAATPAQRIATTPKRLQAVCELAQAMQALPQVQATQQQLAALLQHVAAQAQNYPLLQLVPLLLNLAMPAAAALPERQALLGQVRAALQAALAQPLPPADDHGLRNMAWTCRCTDCKPALIWAESATAQPLQLPLAEARRNHVQQQLHDAAAPLTFAVLKQGSPYKLVLNKAPGLHESRQRERAVWSADWVALETEAKDVAG